jgi:Recombination endonuclease VII
MSASGNGGAGALCGKWMPRKKTTCARRPLHGGPCKTREAMEAARRRSAARVAVNGRHVDPAAKRRENQAYRLVRYGLTREQFERLLEIQEYACAMCRTPFEEDQPIFIDHDHSCCQDEKSSCGNCIRGLLCLSCNTTLGLIERKYDLARAYLNSPPGQLVVMVTEAPGESGRLSASRAVGAAGARLPDTEKVTGSNPVPPTSTTRSLA